MGAFSKTDPTKFVDPVANAIRWLQTGWVLPVVLIGTPVIFYLRKKLDRNYLDAVHKLLDQICEHTFKNEDFDHEQHRRATLFQCKSFYWKRWPFIGPWLIPVERSGEATRKTDAVFRVPDNGEACEGVAGRTYSKRKKQYVPALPDLRADASPENIAKYAEMSFIDPKKMDRKRLPQACALLGFPVDVNNKRWGVLVIDSVHPNIRQQAAQQMFNSLATSLDLSLKGI